MRESSNPSNAVSPTPWLTSQSNQPQTRLNSTKSHHLSHSSGHHKHVSVDNSFMSPTSNHLNNSLNTNDNTLKDGDTISSQQLRYFDSIPNTRPSTPLLNQINRPDDLKTLDINQLQTLADELRHYLLYSAGQSGGHFGANLGTVELTIALHYLLNMPVDQLVWDVGHQAYAHKVLTGRREQLPSIRTQGGLTAFPERQESEYDSFGVGHSSTAISAGLGMSLAMRHQGINASVACVVGDGAMTGGMAFEAMNDAVQQDADLMVVLNDNDMSISCATGGFSQHLAKLWQSEQYIDISQEGTAICKQRPKLANFSRRDTFNTLDNPCPNNSDYSNNPGVNANLNKIDKTNTNIDKEINLTSTHTDNLFKAIGFQYFGPFDGHDLPNLVRVLSCIKQLSGQILVHVITTKGKGFTPAESDPVGYHAIGKQTSQADNNIQPTQAVRPRLKYSQVFGQFLCDKAATDHKLMGITPAMEQGSGMQDFAKQFPKQFFDVAIAEQHAVTLAAGMATQGVKPIVAIYSTFLQRGYDQLIHDVALQNLDVTFAIDRAGLVGEDGATHAGVFDLAYMRCIPNIIIATPKDEHECYHLLNTCYEYQGVSAIRYPRGYGVGREIDKTPLQAQPVYAVGKAVIESRYCTNTKTKTSNTLTSTSDSTTNTKLAILAFGTMTATADSVAKKMATTNTDIDIIVVNMRWVKPLDTQMIDELLANSVSHIATIEEHAIMGGAGSAVNEYLLQQGFAVKVKNLGIPDRYIAHASHAQQLADCQLDADSLQQALLAFIG